MYLTPTLSELIYQPVGLLPGSCLHALTLCAFDSSELLLISLPNCGFFFFFLLSPSHAI